MSDDAALHALPAGHVFDGYRVLRMLGAGGFGITYLAEEVVIGRKVAIKEFLPTGYAARETNSLTVRPLSASAATQFKWGLERFRQEAATLVNFEHPNIVAVHRYFEANGTAYLVMQYVEGKPLDAILSGAKTLAESEIEEVIGPILDGLEQVHAARFLHRDIKPANIYIRRDGRPVLLDFGAARQAFGSETKSITAIVSEGYAPFEQYEAKGDQGPWTDVYALGAVLYRCIAGQRPPAATERVSAKLRGTADPMPPARTAAKETYSRRLLDAIDHALALMPADRPQSIGALRAMLKGGERDGGTSRVVTTIGERAGASGAPSASPPAATPSAPSSPVAPVSGPPTARPKNRVPMFAGIGAAIVAGAIAAYFAASSGKAPDTNVAKGTNPPTSTGSTPTSPSADQLAEAAAEKSATEAQGALDAAKREIGQDDLAAAKKRLADAAAAARAALEKRPGHAGLKRVTDEIAAAAADVERRIPARVQELAAAADRAAQARNDGEADQLVEQIGKLDPSAAAAAREKVTAIREARRRAETEKSRQEEARKKLEQDAGTYLSQASYHLTQARQALARGHLAEARSLAKAGAAHLARAVEAAKAAAGVAPGDAYDPPTPYKFQRSEIEEFERDLARRIAERVTVLLREARAAIAASRLDDAQKALAEAAELDPASAELAAANRELDAARLKAAEDARKADEARRADEARKADDARRAEDERRRHDADRRREEAERKRREDEARRKSEPATPPATPGAFALAGRTGSLSRLSAERRAVMRIRLQFAGGGALAASCTIESPTGGQEACFGQQSGGGRWSLSGSTLCVSSAVINLPANTCYQLSGSGNQVTLSGPGVLAGAMFLN